MGLIGGSSKRLFSSHAGSSVGLSLVIYNTDTLVMQGVIPKLYF